MNRLGYSIDVTREADGTWDVGVHWTLESDATGDISCQESLEVFAEGQNLDRLLNLAEKAIDLHAFMYDKGAFNA